LIGSRANRSIIPAKRSLLVQKGWSVLFAVVMLACLGLWIASPFAGWGLPPGVSTHAADIDRLYYIILAITGFFFVLTETLLVVFMWKYAGRPAGPHAGEKKASGENFFQRLFRPVTTLLHDQHRVELAWTLVPAAILLYIAFAQVGTWAEAKYKSRMPAPGVQHAVNNPQGSVPVQAAISARQFEWRVRYPSLANWQKWHRGTQEAKDGFKAWERQSFNLRHPSQQDDVHVVNELHVIKGRPAVVYMSTIDVIHSFNVPVMRVKQDTLPGRVIPVWFTPTESNTVKVPGKKGGPPRWQDGGGHDDKGVPRDRHKVWEIACAELCGWGHYRMIGKVFVHDTAQDFEEWLRHAEAEHNRRE
jgi:cytochrome c oxidase subunit 2